MATKRYAPLPMADAPPSARAKRPKTEEQQEYALRNDASWSDLRPELVANVATYVDIGADLTNLCVVAGPVVSGIIRQTYLQDNDDYLRYVMSMKRKLKFQRKKQMRNLRGWMEVNTDWAEICGTGSKVGARATGAVIVMKLQPAEALSMKFKRGLGKTVMFSGHGTEGEATGADGLASDEVARLKMALGGCFAYAGCNEEPFDSSSVTAQDDDVLISVGDTRIGSEASFEDVNSLIASYSTSGRKIVLRFIRSGRDFIFKDPVVAIDLGLADVLESMLQKEFVRVNGLLTIREEDAAYSLLWYSLLRAPDNSIFKYLLSTDDIDCSADCYSQAPGCTIVHFIGNRRVSLEECRAIVRHKTADVNTVDTRGKTPLMDLCFRAIGDTSPNSSTIYKANILLRAGADPHLVGGGGVSPIRLVQVLINNGFAHAHELLTLMENARPPPGA